MNIDFVYILVGVLVLALVYLLGRVQGKTSLQIPSDFIEVYKSIQDLPNKVLQAIQGSINPQKGKMAELLTYAELRYDYDRIIPLGQPVDFIGIKNGERVDFIEVKSGSSYELSEEEKHIHQLISLGKVHFRVIKVSEEEINRFVNKSRGVNEN